VQDGNLRLGNTADNRNWEFGYDANDDYFYIDSVGTSRPLKIDNLGSIGIGTAPNPAYRLDVYDLVRVRSELVGSPAVLAESISFAGGTGVRGEAFTREDFPAFGVYGHATTHADLIDPWQPAYGVVGEVTFEGTAFSNGLFIFGVHGIAPFDDDNNNEIYGVFSNGAIGATGTKSFVIDHPLDPENKTLKHYCAEGPEPLNIYSGTIVTDAAGTAWVQLPDYFEAINRDFRYTLTIVDDGDASPTSRGLQPARSFDAPDAARSEDFPLAKIASKIRNNRFAIRTSQPNVEVSWEVKAVRNDRFVQRAGAPVEIEKSAADKGKYLVPALYDQPAEKGIFHHPQPASEGHGPDPAAVAGPAGR